MIKGYIHSEESFGTVDGPGIRYVLFMQGCPLRCLYCHNPDTWSVKGGREITAQEIIEKYNRNKEFYRNGGITVTGGEPMLQIDFLTDLFKRAKENDIHTCIDTSGITFESENDEQIKKIDVLLNYTDLVILDIKHIDSKKHKLITGSTNENVLGFAKYLEAKNIPVWISHVVVPGYTDDEESLRNLGCFIGGLKNVKALNVLPYHTLGVSKYENLKIPYKLQGLKALSSDDAINAKNVILEQMKRIRRGSENGKQSISK